MYSLKALGFFFRDIFENMILVDETTHKHDFSFKSVNF